jgi:integrase
MTDRRILTNHRQALLAKPEEKPYNLNAGGSLFLKVMPNGTKKWQHRYFFFDKAKTLSMGLFPSVGLAEAKEKRDAARKLLAQGKDPSQQRKEEKTATRMAMENSFETIAKEWLSRQTHRADATRNKSEWLLSFAIADFGKRPIREVTSGMVLNTCRHHESQDKLETAHRIKQKCSQVFRYAISTQRLESDPTRDLRGALKEVQTQHRAAITDPVQIAALLKEIDSYQGRLVVKYAMQFQALVFVRPGELRSAKWADIDMKDAEWRYIPPKTRNQTQVELIVPLSRQAIAILEHLMPITGANEYVFHSTGKTRYLSESAILNALRKMGYGGDVMTGHGFRAMAKTVMLEVLKMPDHYIEMQLGHKVRDPNGAAYNRTKFLEDRKLMMQTWADYLDELRQSAQVIPLVAGNTH